MTTAAQKDRQAPWRGWLVGTALGVALIAGLVAVTSKVCYPRPKPPPKESNRVVHPSGFSIITPEDWDHQIGTAGKPIKAEFPAAKHRNDNILIFPKSKVKLCQHLIVQKVDSASEMKQEEQVVAKPDWLRLPSSRVQEKQCGKYFVWSASMSGETDNGPHYTLDLWLPNAPPGGHDCVPEYWRPFINTFRVEPVQAK